MPTFATPDPISVTIELVGDVRITASDRADTVVVVRPHNEAKAGDVTAAEQTRVEYSDGRLLIKAPKRWTRYTMFGGAESIDVTIELPTGSRLEANSALGDFHGDGVLGASRFKTAMGNIRLDHTGALQADTGHGHVTVDRIAGDADVTTGSGDVRIGQIDGAAVIKNSNGDTKVGDVTGDLRVKASNGDIAVDRADRSVVAKTALGDVRIAEVRQGTIVAETATGEIEVGVREGIATWLDVSTKFGMVRNALEATDGPEKSEGTVEVRARSSMGDIVIGRSPGEKPAARRSDAT